MPRNPLDPPDDTITSGPPEGVNEREPLPRTVGRFEVHSLLGKGGMARVYRAFDPTLDRLVALKVLHAPAAGDADAGAQQRKRILREARAAAALTHPNTVTIYEVGEADGQPFIAMELLGGTTLRAAARGDAGPATRFRWLLEAARALHAAHERGLVHRDVKPDNMIVEPDGRLKLLDFGIAKRDYGDAEAALAEIGLTPPDGPSSMRTAEGRRIGTPRYMAPEQWSGESTDGRTDQYAWGLVAVELLTGAVPREGTDVAAELRAHSTPEQVIAVVLRALAPKQNDRAPSMLPVIEALERGATTTPARDALPLAPRVESRDELRRAASIARTVDEPPPPWPPQWSRRALGALGAVVALGGAVYGLRAWGVSRRPAPPSECRVANVASSAGFAPSNIALLGGTTMLGSYDGTRKDGPDAGVELVGAPPGQKFAIPYPSPSAFVRGTTWDARPTAVTLVNRDQDDAPDALLNAWLEGRFVTGQRLDVLATGLAAATSHDGVLVAFTGRDTKASPQRNTASLLALRTAHAPENLRVYETPSAVVDAPALAVSPRNVALLFREGRRLLAVVVDDRLERPGHVPYVVAEGDVGAPAATYVGETLVVVWPERRGGAVTLQSATLAPAALAFGKAAPIGSDVVPMTAPALVPLASGGSLLAWVAGGGAVRGLRLLPRASAPFDLGTMAGARALTARATPEGSLVAWATDEPKSTTLASVSCAATLP